MNQVIFEQVIMYESHKNMELTKNASFDPFTIKGGGGGIFKIKIGNYE